MERSIATAGLGGLIDSRVEANSRAARQRAEWMSERAEADGRLESTATDLLRHSPYAAVRLVACAVCDGVITLTGRVPTYYLKQLAQVPIVHKFHGRVIVENRVVVGKS